MHSMTRGAVTLVFDDGYEHIYRDVLPRLDAAGIPAVFALPLEPAPSHSPIAAPLRPWQQWQTINPRHELAAHSVTHRDLTVLPSTEMNQELAQPADKLGADTLVYPGGAHNSAIAAAAHQYYRAARTVRKGFASLPPQDRYRLPSFDFSRRTFSVARANRLAVQAWLTNRWLIETYHIVSDEITTPEHRVPLQDFLRHLAFLQRLPIRKATIRDLVF